MLETAEDLLVLIRIYGLLLGEFVLMVDQVLHALGCQFDLLGFLPALLNRVETGHDLLIIGRYLVGDGRVAELVHFEGTPDLLLARLESYPFGVVLVEFDHEKVLLGLGLE